MVTWYPLESNPDVMNKYIQKLGVPADWSLTDVFGLEPEQLEWLPQPVKGFILLFPCSETYENHRNEEDKKLKEDSQICPENLFYMKQIIHNACGTIALVHCIANISDIKLNDGILKNYLDKTGGLSPEERGKILEEDESFTDSHQELAQEGQTILNRDEKVNHHFIALINKGGVLYELDGRKSFPIKHGETSDETFVQDAAKICKKFMARDPEDLRFTVLALTATQN